FAFLDVEHPVYEERFVRRGAGGKRVCALHRFRRRSAALGGVGPQSKSERAVGILGGSLVSRGDRGVQKNSFVLVDGGLEELARLVGLGSHRKRAKELATGSDRRNRASWLRLFAGSLFHLGGRLLRPSESS